jgi:hypothetical protein
LGGQRRGRGLKLRSLCQEIGGRLGERARFGRRRMRRRRGWEGGRDNTCIDTDGLGRAYGGSSLVLKSGWKSWTCTIRYESRFARYPDLADRDPKFLDICASLMLLSSPSRENAFVNFFLPLVSLVLNIRSCTDPAHLKALTGNLKSNFEAESSGVGAL